MQERATGQPDHVDEIYVWASVDKKTGLEGIVGLGALGMPMQACSSSKIIADAMECLIQRMAQKTPELTYKLLKFRNPEFVKEL